MRPWVAVQVGIGRRKRERWGRQALSLMTWGRGEGSPLSASVIGIILIGARGWSKSRRRGTAKLSGLSNRFPLVEYDDDEDYGQR